MKLKKQFILFFSLLLQLNLWGQSVDETKQMADRLYDQKQYHEALYFYQRVAFFSWPEAESAVLARIANCFYAQKDFTRAIEFFDHAYFAATNPSEKTDYLFGKITTYLETKNYHSALIELLGQDFPENSQNHYRKELFLATAYFGLEQYTKAGYHFSESVPLEQKEARHQIELLFENPKDFSRPNPKLALILSAILPGAGQVYAGEPGAGLNSLLLTGTFVGMVLYLSVRIHPIDAILTGLPWFQRYYQGGFDHAERTAELARERRRNQIFQQSLKIISASGQ